jgi:hypothetical protein
MLADHGPLWAGTKATLDDNSLKASMPTQLSSIEFTLMVNPLF